MNETLKGRRSLFKQVVRINTLALFFANVLLLVAVLVIMFVSTFMSEKADLEQMMHQLSERVIHIGTPSRIAFSDVTLRDGLNFALYDMDGTPLYLSSYGMPSTEVQVFSPRLEFMDHTDYTTFGRERQNQDLILHATRTVQSDEETLLLHVVSDITYLMTPVRISFTLMVFYLPLVLLIAVLLGRYTGHRAMKPIHEISKQISEKTNANLFEQIDPEETDIEFDDLITAFNSLMQQLEQSFQKQKDFISNASHELRTPLSVMKGHISMLQRWGKDDSKVLDNSLSVLDKETRIMTDMVQELLLLTRADRAALKHNIELFSVKALLEEVRNDAIVSKADACIDLDVPDNLTYESDRSLLQQVLRILMDNSLRYCPPPGRILLSACESDKALIISVQDTGCGIAPEDLVHVFERFYRAPQEDGAQRGNSGLGLAIAQSIIASLGGTISAESKQSEWTRMEIRLPASDK